MPKRWWLVLIAVMGAAVSLANTCVWDDHSCPASPATRCQGSTMWRIDAGIGVYYERGLSLSMDQIGNQVAIPQISADTRAWNSSHGAPVEEQTCVRSNAAACLTVEVSSISCNTDDLGRPVYCPGKNENFGITFHQFIGNGSVGRSFYTASQCWPPNIGACYTLSTFSRTTPSNSTPFRADNVCFSAPSFLNGCY